MGVAGLALTRMRACDWIQDLGGGATHYTHTRRLDSVAMARTKKTARKSKSGNKKRKEMATKSAQKPKPEVSAGGKHNPAAGSTSTAGGGEPTVNTAIGEETRDQPSSSGGETAVNPSSGTTDKPSTAENGPEDRPGTTPTDTEEHEEKTAKTTGTAEMIETGPTKEE